jgi:hypothetical protein
MWIMRELKILHIKTKDIFVCLSRTDELIQRAIREEFRECTVLTVAHRLRTVIDSDRILVFIVDLTLSLIIASFSKVLGNGELLEFDAPDVLLSNPTSHFASFVEQTGLAEAEHLRTLATAATMAVKVYRNRLNPAEELPEANNENDPLLSSHDKIQ